jgi:hypothetical protein
MDFRGEAGFLSDGSGDPKPVHREFGLDGYRHTPQREKDLALWHSAARVALDHCEGGKGRSLHASTKGQYCHALRHE